MDMYVGVLSGNIFCPGDFDLQSLHQERNRKKQQSEEEEGGDSHRSGGGPRKRAEGIVDVQHPVFGRNGEARMKDLCKLTSYDKIVFSGIPERLRSPLFVVTVEGTRDTYTKVQDMDKFTCSDVEWKPRTMTSDVMEEIMSILGLPADEADILIGNGSIGKDKDGKDVFDSDAFLNEVENHEKQAIRDSLYNLESMKMYFRSKVFHTLCPKYYDEDTIACLDWDDMDPLIRLLSTKPHELCYNKFIRFKHEIPKAYKNMAGSFIATIDGKLKLPELTFNQLVDAMDEFKDTNLTDEWELVACLIYDELKVEMNVGKHMYCDAEHIERSFASYRHGKQDMNKFKAACHWLEAQEIIKIDHKRRFYLSQAFRWELSIATSLEMLMAKRQVMHEEEEYVDLQTLRSNRGFHLAGEQIRAFQRHLAYPVLLICGPAGSGKTDFLGCVSRHHPRNKILATSAYGVNAGALDKIFPGRAFTTHQLLYTHRMTCLSGQNPNKVNALMQTSKTVQDKIAKSTKFKISMDDDEEEEKPKEKPKEKEKSTKKHMSKLGLCYEKCIFENVEYLCVDELSTQEPETFSELLSALSCCGQLRGLLMTGDRGQLPAIRRGNVISALYEALTPMGMTIDFEHNHRVKEGSGSLRTLGDAIRYRKVNDVSFDNRHTIHYPLEVRYDATYEQKMNTLSIIIRDVLDSYKLQEYNHHIITRTRDYRTKIIYIVEEYYHLKDPNMARIPYRKNTYWVGRKICFKQNNHELGISNNEIFILKEIFDRSPNGSIVHYKNTSPKLEGKDWKRYITVASVSDTKRVIEISWDEWGTHWINRGSANTVASYQGSQIPNIVLAQPYYSKFDTNENIYTSVTRGEERVIYLGEEKNLKKAILNREPVRRSALSDMVSDCCKRFKDEFEAPDESLADSMDAESKSKGIVKTTKTTMTTVTRETKIVQTVKEVIPKKADIDISPPPPPPEKKKRNAEGDLIEYGINFTHLAKHTEQDTINRLTPWVAQQVEDEDEKKKKKKRHKGEDEKERKKRKRREKREAKEKKRKEKRKKREKEKRMRNPALACNIHFIEF